MYTCVYIYIYITTKDLVLEELDGPVAHAALLGWH